MSWTPQQKQEVWNKGRIVYPNDPRSTRMDDCGAWIVWGHYGNTNSEYGWQIDHIRPVSEGGTDDLSNLRPLQWDNNESKQDKKNSPCPVVANGDHNIRRYAKQ